jgi:hypothetical protein
MEGGTELRIPVFPPPSRLSSPSPGGSQCESPAPLVLTAEEMVQLEQLKRMGPMEPVEAKPVPCGEKIMAFIAIGKTLCNISNNICCFLKSILFCYRYRLPSDNDVM